MHLFLRTTNRRQQGLRVQLGTRSLRTRLLLAVCARHLRIGHHHRARFLQAHTKRKCSSQPDRRRLYHGVGDTQTSHGSRESRRHHARVLR